MELGATSSLSANLVFDVNLIEETAIREQISLLVENTHENIQAVLDGRTLIIKDSKYKKHYEIELAENIVKTMKRTTRDEVNLTIEREVFQKEEDILEIISIRGNILNGAVIGHTETNNPEYKKWIDNWTMKDRNYFGYSSEIEEQFYLEHEKEFVGLEEGLQKAIEKIEEMGVDLVEMAGPSGGGKTKAKDKMFERYKDNTIVTSTDNFYKGLEQMEIEKLFVNGEPDFDNPSAIDSAEFVQFLTDLLHGKTAYEPQYDFMTSKRTGELKEIQPARLTIAEGIFNLRQEFCPNTDAIPGKKVLRIAVLVELFELLIRRIRRDMIRKGYSPIGILKYIKEFVEPSYKKFILQSLRADIYILNRHNPEYKV